MALSKRKLSPYFLLALLLVLGWVSLKVVGVFLNYVLAGLFIAYITHPAYDWLEAKIKMRSVASMLMVLAVTLVIFVPVGLVMVELVGELGSLLSGLDVNLLREQLEDAAQRVLEFFGVESTVGENGESGPGILDVIIPGINAALSRLATNLLGILTEAFVGMFVMLYILYYSYQDGHRFVQSVRDILPLQEAHRDLLMHEVGNVIQAVMYGHVLTALIQAGLAGIGYWIFGAPNVILLSAVSFLLALLPLVGPPLVWGPIGIWMVLSGDTFNGVGLLIYSAIFVSSLDNIIRPKLIGDRAHIHPTVVLLGVLGGIVVFGFAGLILGPLVLSIFVTILDMYRKEFATRMDDDGLPV